MIRRLLQWLIYRNKDKRLITINKLKKKKLSLYSSYYSKTTIQIIKSDVVSNIILLDTILKQDFLNNEVVISDISRDDFIFTTISKWYTYNKTLIDDNDILLQWLNKSHAFIEKYNECKLEYNLRRLKPLVKHIEIIINILDKKIKP